MGSGSSIDMGICGAGGSGKCIVFMVLYVKYVWCIIISMATNRHLPMVLTWVFALASTFLDII